MKGECAFCGSKTQSDLNTSRRTGLLCDACRKNRTNQLINREHSDLAHSVDDDGATPLAKELWLEDRE